MRLLFARIEELAPAPFILLVGLVSGTLQGIPIVLVGSASSDPDSRARVVIVAVSAVLWWIGAMLLWWTTVRRLRFSVWRAAAHVTLALIVGDLLTSGLAFVSASFQTRGDFTAYLVHTPLAFAWGFAVPTFVRSVIRFVVFAVSVALGRLLPGNGAPAPLPASPIDHEAVT